MADTVEDLPYLLAEVAEAAGMGAALRLAAEFGGIEQMYVPRPERLTPDHKLVKALGPDAAAAVCQALGGGAHDIPMLARNNARQIRELLDKGYSGAQVARKVGVHQRTVRRHRNRAQGDDRQGGLF